MRLIAQGCRFVCHVGKREVVVFCLRANNVLEMAGHDIKEDEFVSFEGFDASENTKIHGVVSTSLSPRPSHARKCLVAFVDFLGFSHVLGYIIAMLLLLHLLILYGVYISSYRAT